MRIFGILLAGVLATGCYATASPGYYGPAVAVEVGTPDLVYAAPGVQVVAGYDGDPVFYTDGFYWRETGGVWYRSSYHTGGWISYSAPRSVYSIQNRHSYRNYRPAGYTPRAYRNNNNRNVRHDVRHDSRPAARNYGNNRPDSRVNNGNHNAPTTQKRETPRQDNRPAARSKDKDKRK